MRYYQKNDPKTLNTQSSTGAHTHSGFHPTMGSHQWSVALKQRLWTGSISTLFQLSRLAILINILCSFILFTILIDFNPTVFTLSTLYPEWTLRFIFVDQQSLLLTQSLNICLWFGAILSIDLLRAFILWRWTSDPMREDPVQAKRWRNLFVLGVVASALCWSWIGQPPIFDDTNVLIQAVIIVFLLSGLSLALFSLYPAPWLYALYVFISITPLTFICFFTPHGHWSIGLVALGLTCFGIALGWRHSESFLKTLRLSIEMESLAVKMKEAKEEAESASVAKSRFLANMSHELRTPLNGIMGMAQLLSSSEPDEDRQRRLNIIHKSGQSLLVLINDVLDFSKIEAGKMLIHQEAFNVKELIESTAELLQGNAKDKKLAFKILPFDLKIPQLLIQDPSRIRQVLINLIGNAIKFTTHGEVKISIELTHWDEEQQDLCWLQINVADTGVGLAPHQIERIFMPFLQADTSTSRKFGGTGLGLSISKKLCELMGGQLGVESIEGQGSRFFFHLPFKVANETTLTSDHSSLAAPNSSASSPLSLMGTVLLVEDNLVNQEVAVGYLSSIGVEVIVANNGLEAVDQFEKHSPHLILMDCQMPEMDGYEATRKIRSLERDNDWNETPIVALTANAYSDDHRRSIESGMNDHLTKPIDQQKLYAVLRQHLPENPDAEGSDFGAMTLNSPQEEGETKDYFTDPQELQSLLDQSTTQSLLALQADGKLLRSALVNWRDQVLPLISEFDHWIQKQQTIPSQEDELQHFVEMAHTTKGASLSVGARVIGNRAGLLETLLRSELPENNPHFRLIPDHVLEILSKDPKAVTLNHHQMAIWLMSSFSELARMTEHEWQVWLGNEES